MNLPARLEKLIWEGKAKFRTLTVGGDTLNVVPIPEKTFWILLNVSYVPSGYLNFYQSGNQTATLNALNSANSSSAVIHRLQMADARGIFMRRFMQNPYNTAVFNVPATSDIGRIISPVRQIWDVYEPITGFCSIAAGIIAQTGFVKGAPASWNFPEVIMHNPYVQASGAVTNADTVGGRFPSFGNELTQRFVAATPNSTDELTPAAAGFSPANTSVVPNGPIIELSFVEVFETIPQTLT